MPVETSADPAEPRKERDRSVGTGEHGRAVRRKNDRIVVAPYFGHFVSILDRAFSDCYSAHRDMSEFLDPSRKIHKHGEKLPHWDQSDVMQFVTFRLADAMPATKVRIWKEEHESWLKFHPKPWTLEQEEEYRKRFVWKLENWLDEGAGSCLFREASIRGLLEEVLMHDDGARAEHHAWVIMPNHVHLLFTARHPVEMLMKNWKGISARKIGLGSIWQKGYRDTMIRDGEHFGNAVRYIRRNPAKLRPGSFSLWESERARAVK